MTLGFSHLGKQKQIYQKKLLNSCFEAPGQALKDKAKKVLSKYHSSCPWLLGTFLRSPCPWVSLLHPSIQVGLVGCRNGGRF